MSNFELTEKIRKKLLKCRVSVLGIGYVGLPLAIEFAKRKKCIITNFLMQRKVVGFDINQQRVYELNNGFDSTKEIRNEDFNDLKLIKFTTQEEDLYDSDVFIITVPTPINNNKKPDLNALLKASKIVGKAIKNRKTANNDNLEKPLIIFESTVYPGVTEEICIPIIEEESISKLNKNFYCGYSPERINPGDSKYKLINIKKVTSGSCDQARLLVDFLYASIIDAGTFSVDNIKIAEAAKVIENTQRDLNIALVNELSLIFRKLNIDTLKVLEAAETKWNFMSFRPGLVGGHCIGVDPYYLTYKAQEMGYYPEVVLAGRKINDAMSTWIANEVVDQLKKNKTFLKESKVLFLGVTFKENCPDTRNSKSIEIINQLELNGIKVTIVDPLANIDDFKKEFKKEITHDVPGDCDYDAYIVAVSHDKFLDPNFINWREIGNKNKIIFDIKGILPINLNAIRL